MVRVRRRRQSDPVPEDDIPFDNSFDENFLISGVGAMDRKPEEVRTGRRLVHISSLIDYCARREALALTANLQGASSKLRDVFSGERIIWALGRAAESHVRKQFIASRNGRGILGKWSCVCGATHATQIGTPRRECPQCSKPLSEYNEVSLVDEAYGIVGNPDLIFVRPDNQKRRVVEIKSMNAAEFKELSAPVAIHVLQASAYARLLNANDQDADSTVTIFYVCKDFNVRPYKSFSVPITQEINNRLDYLWSLAAERQSVVDAVDSGASAELPPRLPSCVSPTSTRAKGCSECVGCFSRS